MFFPLKMVIFHSYVSLPEGLDVPWVHPNNGGIRIPPNFMISFTAKTDHENCLVVSNMAILLSMSFQWDVIRNLLTFTPSFFKMVKTC